MAKPRLTHEQHNDIGRTLAGIADELTRRIGELGSAYPKSGPASEPTRKLTAARDAVNAARMALDKALFAEHPDTAESTVYYPLAENRSRVVAPTGRRADTPQ
ncbi:hypothetical protein [Streptomyces sp. NPDC097640]|uniref:hypothetical protein n=1 Tax=Streptomyces sp. NPDC097640 TaxID=3157229 RepID=UPI0033330F09